MMKLFSKKYFFFIAIILLVAMSFSFAETSFAQNDPQDSPIEAECGTFDVMCMINNVLLNVVWGIGKVVTLLMGLFATLLTISKFTDAHAVQVGWTLVRDLTNLFFVLVVLAIAIGTILRIESYNLKKALPRVVLMAIAVNFSLLIFGLIVDFAQVIMFTFVSSFQETLAGNFLINGLGLDGLTSAEANLVREKKTTQGAIFLNLAFAAILLLVSLIVIFVMLLVLVIRTVMLWLLAVLSPLPYLLSAFPQGQKYAQMWWSEFTKYVIIGPAFAFFLWLSLAVMAVGNTPNGLDNVFGETGLDGEVKQLDGSSGSELFVKGSKSGSILTFIISISMLLGGLVFTQKAGVAGGNLAGGGLGVIKGLSKAGIKKVGRTADKGFRGAQKAFLTKTRPGQFLTGAGKEKRINKKRSVELARIEASKERQLGNLEANRDARRKETVASKNRAFIGINKKQQKIDLKKKELDEKLKSGAIDGTTHKIRMKGVEVEQARLNKDKESVNERHEGIARRVEDDYNAGKDKIEKTIETREGEKVPKAYERSGFRTFMARVSEDGVTGNYAEWKKGIQDLRSRRINDETSGLGGTVHDLASQATSFGKDKTSFGFMARMKKINEETKILSDATGGDTDLVLQEWHQARESGNGERLAAAEMLLAKNIDENEPYKGEHAKRIEPMMRAALKDLGEADETDGNGKATGNKVKLDDDTIDSLVRQWHEDGEVNHGYMAAARQHLLKKNLGNEDLAARVSKVIGIQSLANGSGTIYGGEQFNTSSKKMEFLAPVMQKQEGVFDDKGNQVYKLEVSNQQAHNVSGKIAMIQPRKYLASMSPRNIGVENEKGEIMGLSMMNKSNLTKLFNESILKTIASRGHELKPDILGKPIDSKKWRDEMAKFADDLENNWQDYSKAGFSIENQEQAKEQAERIRDLPIVIAASLGRGDILQGYKNKLGTVREAQDDGKGGKTMVDVQVVDKIVRKYNKK